MKNQQLRSVFEYLDTHEGVDINEEDFLSLARTALDRIGNTEYRIINHVRRVEDHETEVPDDCLEIIQCSYLFEDSRATNEEYYYNNDYRDFIYEQNNETFNFFKSEYDLSGKIAEYKQIGNRLIFQETEFWVNIYCKVEITDENEEPFISEKEKRAIADFVSKTYFYKKALTTQNKFFFELYQKKEADWQKSCANARVGNITNDVYNTMSDTMTSWDRKQYNITFKPNK